jgi:hypothetical protein
MLLKCLYKDPCRPGALESRKGALARHAFGDCRDSLALRGAVSPGSTRPQMSAYHKILKMQTMTGHNGANV